MIKTIIIEIPHQFPPTAWAASSEQQIISIADSRHGLVYERYTLQKALDCWGDDDHIPDELAELLKDHGEAVEIGDTSGTEYCAAEDAGTEIEAAKDAIAHDLSGCHFLTLEEAKEFAHSHRGHQSVEARIAVQNALEDNLGELR